jgi:alcohol dehydrogenase YqhD (iron-dependent ADH family)
MLNFVFDNKTRIVFGKGTENEVGAYTKQFGKKVLLHYGGGSIKRFGLYDKVVKSLEENGVEFVELGGVLPNPRLSLVHEGIELCRKENVDFILAVGGGSVIDSAKAIAMGVPYDGDVWDFYMDLAVVGDTLPIGTVLTIPAAGSESSTGSVITNWDAQLKKDAGKLSLRPVFAILNPEITYTLPNYQTACGAVDMIGHVIERYFTNVEHTDLTDRICEGIMKTAVENAPLAIANNEDYHSRAELMWAGVLAHNDIAGTGREADWATHVIEHELSAIYDIAHGAGLAMIYPAWMKYVYKNRPALFAQFGKNVFGLKVDENNLEKSALASIAALEDFYKSIGMPTRMSDFDIDGSRIEEMARKATQNDTKTFGSFMKLKMEDVINILKLAL